MLLTNGSTNHNASNNWIDQSQCCYHPRGFHLVKKQILNVYNLFKDERFNEERLMCLCLVSNERFVSEPKFVFQFDSQCQTAIQIHVKLKNGHLGKSQQWSKRLACWYIGSRTSFQAVWPDVKIFLPLLPFKKLKFCLFRSIKIAKIS